MNVLWQSWWILGEMAPYLLFGFAVAGLMSVWISPEWIERHMGGRGMRAVLEAALWGIPVPLCSCSVIPVVASMRRHGASRAATRAFLLSSPQTGIDGIAVTYALLGPIFALFRPIVALVSGLLGGALVLGFDGPRRDGSDPDAGVPPCTDCCCCADRESHGVLARALRYGFIALPHDLALSLLFGIVLAGALAALVPANVLTAYLGGGILSILLAMAAGIPFYVCATASVPIAVGLIHLGASPGTALAFLIAGPATNAVTLATVWKILGRRAALLYLATVAVSAVFGGLVLDAIFLIPVVKPWLWQVSTSPEAAEHRGWISGVWAVALLVVLVVSAVVSRWPHSHAEHGS